MVVCIKKPGVASKSIINNWGVLIVMHGRSRMAIDPRVPTMSGRDTSSFHRPVTGRGGLPVSLQENYHHSQIIRTASSPLGHNLR